LRVFRGRRDPPVPSRPVSLLDGKEGVDGSSPSEGFSENPAEMQFCLMSRREGRARNPPIREPGQPLRIEHDPHLFGVFADVTWRRRVDVDVPDADEDVVFLGRRPAGRDFRRQIEAG